MNAAGADALIVGTIYRNLPTRDPSRTKPSPHSGGSTRPSTSPGAVPQIDLFEMMTVEEATAKFPVQAGIARYGAPEEIAELLAFIVSPAAKWMTGAKLRRDGGEVKSI